MDNKTITVRRGGSYLTITAEARDRYLAKGYDVVDEGGNIVEASVPNDVNVLKAFYKQHLKQIAELEAEIKQLKSKKQVPEKVVITEAPVVKEEPKVVEEEVVETKPKTTKRSRKS